MFAPLAFTKTYAMAAAAGLAVTLIPVLMGYLIRGRIPDERKNPLSRCLIALYRPLLEIVLRFPKATLLGAALLAAAILWPVARLGGEFIPALDEGEVLYLKNAWQAQQAGGMEGEADLLTAIREGAVLRVRPKAMTVAVIIAGLVPIMLGAGTGSEVMQRIAAPMVGGMISAPLLSMFVVPAAYLLLRRRQLRRKAGAAPE